MLTGMTMSRIPSPSLRGRGLKYRICKDCVCTSWVSLFTREWIEIFFFHRLPLAGGSPSLRGSGLKLLGFIWKKSKSSVSLFTREWIEIKSPVRIFAGSQRSPSLRGSGLKSVVTTTAFSLQLVSLFTREWIEIIFARTDCQRRPGLPLYEGVD